MKVLAGLVAACFLVTTLLTSWEGGGAILFGWFPFLDRAAARLTPDWPSIAVGVGTLALFTAGFHAMASAWQRQRPTGNGEPLPVWKLRSTLSIVAMLIVLFTAGISIIGIVHQTTWLVRSDRPLYHETVARREYYPKNSTKALEWIGRSLWTQHDFDRKESFPPGGTFAKDGAMLHSWETHILPGLNYASSGIDMTKPWNDPVNQKYFKCILPDVINPDLRDADIEDNEGYGLSHYAGNSHVMGPNRSMKLADIKDGTSNTLLIGEVNAEFKPWGHPVNWRDPTLGINRSPRGFGGVPGAGGANFAMADGTVRFLSDKISPAVLRALSTPNGGEKIREDDWKQP